MATVCRISGQLATDACAHAPDADAQGNLTIRSQVYTEYFVRGTEPTEYCPIHGAGGLMEAIATSGA